MLTNHGSIEFLKFPDPQHPGDNTRLIKKWLRDSWARRKIAALAAKIPHVYNDPDTPLIIEARTLQVPFSNGSGTIQFQNPFTSVLGFSALPGGSNTATAMFLKVVSLSSTQVKLICNNMTSGSNTLSLGNGNITIYYIAVGY